MQRQKENRSPGHGSVACAGFGGHTSLPGYQLRLTHVANYDALVRNILGVLPDLSENEFEYQNILDNVSLIDE